MSLFKGSGVAMVTAFSDSGINYGAQEKIIQHILQGGTNAIFVCGTTGEPSTMTAAEREALLDFTIKTVNKRVPVYAGSGGNNTAETVRFSRRCQDIGADGLMVVTPYYNKCTQNGLVQHYAAIGEAVNIPIIAYNVPGRTGVDIKPETAARLAQIKNIRAIKEASGDIHQISETMRLTQGKLITYSGDDSLTLPAVALGAAGVVSVAANVIPDKVSLLTKLALDGKFSAAAKEHFAAAPLMKLLFCEVNPIPVKKALQFLGFDAGIPRLPLTEMEKENAVLLHAEMQRLGLIKS
ncbi:MAG: 4-hydroxy-tetrahydrodipicolinate synthase [Firmicutes bacterium]|nr:4-hydroxy-tetrahydrodipicolinate synthase [Bacillota bacterium]